MCIRDSSYREYNFGINEWPGGTSWAEEASQAAIQSKLELRNPDAFWKKEITLDRKPKAFLLLPVLLLTCMNASVLLPCSGQHFSVCNDSVGD